MMKLDGELTQPECDINHRARWAFEHVLIEDLRGSSSATDMLRVLKMWVLTAATVLGGGRRRGRTGRPADVQRPFIVFVPVVRARRQQRLPAVHRQTTRVIIAALAGY